MRGHCNTPEPQLMPSFSTSHCPSQADFVEPLPAGCPHSRQAVIGHYLSFLKDYLHEQLRRTYGQKFQTQYSLKYCFTIPAGWSEEAKFLMRQ